MEQRPLTGKSHWYHETQSSRCASAAQSLVPKAAQVANRFILDTPLPAEFQPGWLAYGEAIAHYLLADNIKVSRLHTLSSYDRISTALTVAQVYQVQRVCDHYAARLAPLPGPDSSRASNIRLTQITQYARMLASQPGNLPEDGLAGLVEVGLTQPDIISFIQIIGFVGFQARIVALLRAINGENPRWLPGLQGQSDAPPASVEASGLWVTRWQPAEPGHRTPAPHRAVDCTQALSGLALIAPLLAEDAESLALLAHHHHTLAANVPAEYQALLGLLSARINGSPWCFHTLGAASHPGLPGVVDSLYNGDRAFTAWLQGHPRWQALSQAAGQLIRHPGQFQAAIFSTCCHDNGAIQPVFNQLAWVAFCGWLNRLNIALIGRKQDHQGTKETLPGIA